MADELFTPIIKDRGVAVPVVDGQLIASTVEGECGLYIDYDGVRHLITGEGTSIVVGGALKARIDLSSDPQEQLSNHAGRLDNLDAVVNALAAHKTCNYAASEWSGNAAPYSITIPAESHGLGVGVKVEYFNDGSDDFEWRKDTNGNVTIFSNVKVAMEVNLK